MDSYENPEQNGKKTLWIIGGVILVVMIIGLIYGATQKTLKRSVRDDDTATGSLVSQNDQVKGLSRDTAEKTPVTIDGLTLVNLETFPYRVQAKITGTVSDGCSIPDVQVNQVNKTLVVDVVGLREPELMCTTVITSFEKVVDLPVAGLAAGTYTVTLGSLNKTFTLAAENNIQFSGDK